MSIMKKVQNLDTRIIYLLAWLFVLFPLINPLGLPIPISNDARTWYNYVENEVNDGDTVIFSLMYGTSGMPELFPMSVATMKHILEKDVKIVVVTFWVEGPLVFDTLLGQVDPADYGKVYGEDWINLGYIPGSETAIGSLATSFQNTVANDYVEGRPLSSFAIMDDIKSANDIDLIISFETGTPGTPEWLRQWNTAYGVPQITGCIGVSVPGMIPYINSGQLAALMPGLTVSAEYEVLLNKPGLAVAGVDAVSTSHLLVVLLVIIGNIAYFMTKEDEK
jgi:hypothetical protein